MSLITTTPDLIVFCKKAALSSYITVDTEFIRETTYWPQLCLIQVGLEDKAVAIDPLAKDIDLQPFFGKTIGKRRYDSLGAALTKTIQMKCYALYLLHY